MEQRLKPTTRSSPQADSSQPAKWPRLQVNVQYTLKGSNNPHSPTSSTVHNSKIDQGRRKFRQGTSISAHGRDLHSHTLLSLSFFRRSRTRRMLLPLLPSFLLSLMLFCYSTRIHARPHARAHAFSDTTTTSSGGSHCLPFSENPLNARACSPSLHLIPPSNGGKMFRTDNSPASRWQQQQGLCRIWVYVSSTQGKVEEVPIRWDDIREQLRLLFRDCQYGGERVELVADGAGNLTVGVDEG